MEIKLNDDQLNKIIAAYLTGQAIISKQLDVSSPAEMGEIIKGVCGDGRFEADTDEDIAGLAASIAANIPIDKADMYLKMHGYNGVGEDNWTFNPVTNKYEKVGKKNV